jgi:hypothetical protein
LTREPVLSGRGWDHLVTFSDYPLINLGFRRLCKAKLASTKTGPQREFTLTESETYSGGLIALKYKRVRGKAAVEAKSTSKSKRKRYELAGLRERLPGANRRSRSTDTYLDGYGVLPGISNNVGPVKHFLSRLLSFHLKEFFSFVFFLLSVDDHGSPVIFRSVSVRPKHLFDPNFDHDYYCKLPLAKERDAHSLGRRF